MNELARESNSPRRASISLSTQSTRSRGVFPALHWIVANANRALPFLDAWFDLVASVTGPKNSAEFRRVMRAEGRALIAVPAADDLIELRSAVLGSARETELDNDPCELDVTLSSEVLVLQARQDRGGPSPCLCRWRMVRASST